MILSFPADAWLLLFVAVGLGLGLELAYYRARRADPRDPGRRVGAGPRAGSDRGDASPRDRAAHAPDPAEPLEDDV